MVTMSDVYRGDGVSVLLERVLRNAKRRRVATLLLEELYDREELRHIADGRGKYSGCRPGGGNGEGGRPDYANSTWGRMLTEQGGLLALYNRIR